MSLIIFPAIDLLKGQVVRLRQGDPAAQTVFSSDPVAVARSWEAAGAEWLHVVNLDGALQPQAAGDAPAERVADLPQFNLQALAAIRAATVLPIQYGGGMRTIEDMAAAIDQGATRIILGTVAVEHPEIVAASLQRFGAERIVVALDARGGKVSTHGWQTTSQVDVLDAARRLRSMGALRALYTDVARDGTLSGVNAEATAELARSSGLRVVASGGVAALADIRALAAHSLEGIEGVVVGQALYTGLLDLADAISAGRKLPGGGAAR
jgi:phosphoribosylformimino-5-aminoimidazole carboxamide ribotide isomerase